MPGEADKSDSRQPPDSQEDAVSCVVLELQVHHAFCPQAIETQHTHRGTNRNILT